MKQIKLSIIPSGNASWIVKYNRNGMIPGFVALISILIFIFLFLFLTRRKVSYITEIASGVKTISKGNLDYRIGVRGNDELSLLAKELNYMAHELDEYLERKKTWKK